MPVFSARHTLSGPSAPPRRASPRGGERLGSECQHRVCTLLQHMVWHNLVSESGCRDRQRLACTIVCYYTSLCVPVFQIRHTRQGVTSCPLCIRACARRQCSRADPHPLPTSSPRPALRAMSRTESDMHLAHLSHLILHASVWHAYCTAITPHSACPRLTCPACFSSTSHPLETVCTGGLTPPHDHDQNIYFGDRLAPR